MQDKRKYAISITKGTSHKIEERTNFYGQCYSKARFAQVGFFPHSDYLPEKVLLIKKLEFE